MLETQLNINHARKLSTGKTHVVLRQTTSAFYFCKDTIACYCHCDNLLYKMSLYLDFVSATREGRCSESKDLKTYRRPGKTHSLEY